MCRQPIAPLAADAQPPSAENMSHGFTLPGEDQRAIGPGDFYFETLQKLLSQGVLRQDMRILVVCAGDYDRRTLLACGFTDVTISNLDDRPQAAQYAPFSWRHEDAEALKADDKAYDICIAHSGLHHCRSPHTALLEMYRVSKLGLIVFEPADNLTSRVATHLGLGQQYEVAAVADNDCQAGGVRNTLIPNFVYRWSPREIEKTIRSFDPVGQHRFLYFYAMRLNWERARVSKNKLLYFLFCLLAPAAWLFSKIFPAESNNFAFVVLRPHPPHDLHPWITHQGGQISLNESWIRERYHNHL